MSTRELIRDNAVDLKRILIGVSEPAFNDFIRSLEDNAVWLAVENFAATRAQTRKLTLSKLFAEIDKASSALENLEEFYDQYGSELSAARSLAYENLEDISNKFFNEVHGRSDYEQLRGAAVAFEGMLLRRTAMELEKDDDLLRAPRHEVYRNMFLCVGELMVEKLSVMPTTTYDPEVESIGDFAKIMLWIFDIFGEEPPKSFGNLLRAAVKEIRRTNGP